MWKCPKCETINNGSSCTVCSEPKPTERQTVLRSAAPVIPSAKEVVIPPAATTASGMGRPSVRADATRERKPSEAYLMPEEPKKGMNKFVLTLLITIIIGISALILGFISCQIVKLAGGTENEASEAVKPRETEAAKETESAEPTEEAEETGPYIKEITSISALRTTYGGVETRYGDIITIETTAEGTPDVQFITDPDRLVVDFENFGQTLEGSELGRSGNCFTDIRYATHDTYTRIVIDLSKDVDYTVDTYEDRCEIRIIEK